MSKKMNSIHQKTTKYTDNLADKKMTVLKDNRSNRTLSILVVAGILLVAGGAFAYLSMNSAQSNVTATADSSQSTATPTTVSYPVSLFEDGKARHFEHKNADMTIRYFILKSSDGVIRAAFDACDVCWPSGKGYVQEGDNMVCRNCGRKFASIKVNEVKGGCNPAPLNRVVQEGQLVLQVSDILDGSRYFNFSEKGART